MTFFKYLSTAAMLGRSDVPYNKYYNRNKKNIYVKYPF